TLTAPALARADGARLQLSGDLQQPPPGIDLHERYHTGVIMRDIGVPMILIGVGLLGTSIYLFSKATPLCLSFYADTCPPDNGYARLGAVTLLGSFAHLGVGIPLWAVGQHRINQSQSWGFVPYAAPVEHGGVAGVTIVGF